MEGQGEASRNESLNHFDEIVKRTRFRNIQVLSAECSDDEVQVSCIFRFHAVTKDWIVDVRMRVRTEDRLIDRLSIEYLQVTVLQKWGFVAGVDASAPESEPELTS